MAKAVGEWAGKNASKQASGLASHHACETRRGFEKRCERLNLKVFCRDCSALRGIVECVSVQDETANSSTYSVILSDCGHQRSVTVAVEFTRSQQEKRGWTQETEIPEAQSEDQIEAEAIRADMADRQLI
jgi:hypothetical protein